MFHNRPIHPTHAPTCKPRLVIHVDILVIYLTCWHWKFDRHIQ